MKSKRGSLKIFLGYAAGVGKTYAMLQTAHLMKERGMDVVIGYVEPHQRVETARLCEGLETIENRSVDYKGLHLKEFDLEAALKRNPELILVDELAHSNYQGSRHEKRFQDIQELLEHGIDVFTTVNIQHFESVNDIIESMTGVVVNERIPDSIFDYADVVELMDMDPKALIDRLNAGKIYEISQAKRALNNFFKEETLIALRELALRKTADVVKTKRARDFGVRDGSTTIREHILVCVSASPSNKKVIRNAARMVEAFNAEFTAVYVIEDDSELLNSDNQVLIENLRLADDLGAVITPLYGSDSAMQISSYAKMSHITKIVLGRNTNSKLRALFFRPFVEKLMENTSDIDIYVIPDSSESKVRLNFSHSGFPILKSIGSVLSLLLIATLFGGMLDATGFSEANIITLYILAVVFISVMIPNVIVAAIASTFSVVVFNFMFTEPRYSLDAYDSGYPVTFFIMFLSAFITSTLAAKLKSNDRSHVKKAYLNEILLETSLKLQNSQSLESMISDMGLQIKRILNRSVIIYVPIEDVLVPTVFSDETPEVIHDEFLSSQEVGIATWVYQNNRRAGSGTRTLSNSKCIYYAIRSHGTPVGVIGIDIEQAWDQEDKNIVLLILNEFGLALESYDLNSKNNATQLQIQNEKLRSNILRTISHDLRTPLTSISGNARNLLARSMDDNERTQITKDIFDDAQWLSSLVENILVMTRLDKEGSILELDMHIFDDICEEAIRYLKERLVNHRLEFKKANSVTLVEVDAKLMVQVMVNLIDNAIKYTPNNSLITVELSNVGDELCIQVKDEGSGIIDDDKASIFEMFFKSQRDGGDHNRGIGLGLYLCQSIVKAHKSALVVKDNTPQGCIFEFALPTVKGEKYV